MITVQTKIIENSIQGWQITCCEVGKVLFGALEDFFNIKIWSLDNIKDSYCSLPVMTSFSLACKLNIWGRIVPPFSEPWGEG